jgi:hypothetical protein
MPTTIKQADLIESIAAALQYISYYHPADYIAHLARAYEREQSPAAKDAIAQILTNSKMSATGHRPICQDTGIVNVFLKIGMDVRLEGFTGSLEDAVNEGVRRGYLHPDNTLRASVVADPHFDRKNTNDNAPAVVNVELVPGNKVEVTVAAKGGGSENKSKMMMLNPERLHRRLGAQDRADHGRRLVPARHAGHRHRRHRGEGGAAGQGSADGRPRHVRAAGQEGRRPKLSQVEAMRWSCTRRSTRWASARRAWAASPPCSTSRSRCSLPRRRQAGRDDSQLRRHAPRALRDGRLRSGLPRPAEPRPVAARQLEGRHARRASAST